MTNGDNRIKHETIFHSVFFLLLFRLFFFSCAEHCEQFLVEYCYYLYRTRQDNEAKKVLTSLPEQRKSVALWNLEAQVLYRLRHYVPAVSIYEAQAKKLQSDDEMLLLNTNLLACYVSAGFPDKAVNLAGKMRERKELSYEATYNMACALLDMGQLQAAQECLSQAEQKSLESLQKYQADEETKQDELAVLVVQMAYVLQLLRKPNEAKEMYLKVLSQKPSDEAVLATANNNLMTLRRQGEKVFDALKRSERALKVSPHKVTTRQLRAFRLNHCLLLVYGKKGDKIQKQISELQSAFEGSEMPTLVLAALYYRQKNYSKCMQTLQEAIDKNPESALQARLALAYMALRNKDLGGAVEALRSITQVAHRPATVATLVQLYVRSNRVPEALQCLEDAIEHWGNMMDTSDDDGSSSVASRERLILMNLLERAGEFCQGQKMFDEAVKFYQRLATDFSHDPEDAQRFRALLVLAVARSSDRDKALQYARQLPSSDELGLEVSVERLLDPSSKAERTFRSRARETKRSGKPMEDISDGEGEGGRKKAKKKKKRRVRYPKGFDPENPGPLPDPERWLPRWERASFQKSKFGDPLGEMCFDRWVSTDCILFLTSCSSLAFF